MKVKKEKSFLLTPAIVQKHTISVLPLKREKIV